MGKKKKALQAEIDRLNAQKPRTEVTSYKNLDQTPRTSVAAVLGSAMTGYKTSSGPSMYGDSYNYKEINSCGPSMKVDLKEIPAVDLKEIPEVDLKEIPEVDESDFAFKVDGKKRWTPIHSAASAYHKAGAKLDEIEGKNPGTKKMAVESLFRLGEAGVKSAASLIANKRKASLGSSNAFAPRQRSGGGGYSSKSQPSYAELLSKY